MKMPVSKPLTIKDIARLAGVAKSTVSEVVNNNIRSRVGKATYEKVKKVIDKYHYEPQSFARALSMQRTYQLGFLVSSKAVPGLANVYYGMALAGVEAVCTERGYRCMVTCCDLSDVEKFVIPDKLRRRCVDALVLAGTISDEAVAMIRKLGIPVCTIGSSMNGGILQIQGHSSSAYTMVFERFHANGHRRVLAIYDNEPERKKVIAGMDAVNAAHPEDSLLIEIASDCRDSEDCCEFREFRRGARFAAHLAKTPSGDRATAVVGNDQVCSGFIQTAFANGLQCPRDFSIISGCDSPLCEWAAVPISAIENHIFQHGQLAANLMIDLLDKCRTEKEVARIARQQDSVELIIRASDGPVPGLKNNKGKKFSLRRGVKNEQPSM